MARVLVTGVSGFIGSHLVRSLAHEHDVTGTICTAKSAPLTKVHTVDLTEGAQVQQVLGDARPDIVVHCAAMSRVLICEANSDLARSTNAVSTGVIAEWCVHHHARLIYFSSDQVFSGKRGLYAESDVPDPINVYGKTKLEAERLVLAACPWSVVVRSNSVVGGAVGWGESFTDWVKQQANGGANTPLFTDQFRSPIHIWDLCELVLRIIASDYSGVLHAGGPERLSRWETAERVLAARSIPFANFVRASFLTHPTSAIMPADTSYQLDDVLRIMPELASRDIGGRLANEEREPMLR